MVEYVVANWDSLLLVITSVISLAALIAKLTPTQVDDEWVAKIARFVQFFAMTPKDAKTTKK